MTNLSRVTYDAFLKFWQLHNHIHTHTHTHTHHGMYLAFGPHGNWLTFMFAASCNHVTMIFSGFCQFLVLIPVFSSKHPLEKVDSFNNCCRYLWLLQKGHIIGSGRVVIHLTTATTYDCNSKLSNCCKLRTICNLLKPSVMSAANRNILKQ